MKKVKINILVSFICLLFANSLFAQVNPHDRMIKRMKDSGLTDKEIEHEVNEINSFYQKQIEEEFNKIQNAIIKENKENENKRLACTDIPASEKAVLQAIYDNLNGPAWATNWDFNTPVTSWNSSTQTGWYGVQVDNNCNIRSLTFSLPNDVYSSSFPDLTNLTMLRSLYIYTIGGSSHSQPFYFSGDFSSIGNLLNLEDLFLHNFDFQGSMPVSFLNLKDNIKQFRLSHCNLNNNSQLCSIIGEFDKLRLLDLGYNFYSGSLPTCFLSNNYPFLQTLAMQDNSITDISVVSSYSTLQVIWFGNNEISGSFPDLSNNLDLYSTILYLNAISGTIATDFPSNVYILLLGWNNLSGEVPVFNNNDTGYSKIEIHNNEFVFKDLEVCFNHYQDNFSVFNYSQQAKTDNVINDNVSIGSSYTMTMHENGNDSAMEMYQWYKGSYPSGTAIAEATSRQYTIPSVQLSDAGSYYCLSTHPTITIPSDYNKNLVLQREQVNLNVINCEPISGSIDIVGRVEQYLCGDFWRANFGFNSLSIISEYNWIVKSPTGNVIHTSTNETSGTINFSGYGVFTIELEVTTPDGCIHNFSSQVELVECEPESCTISNPNSQVVKQLFVDLMNHLKDLPTVPNGYTCPELDLLEPYVSDTNPKIYNFTKTSIGSNNDEGEIKFSFDANHPNDVSIYYKNSDFIDISLDEFIIVDDYFTFYTYYENGTWLDRGKHFIKHIDFCPDDNVSCTATNPNSQVVKGLFIDLINFLITQNSLPDGYTCSQLTLLAPYVQPDDPVAIYNFTNPGNYIRFSFSDHGEDHDVQIPYNNSGIIINDLGLQNYFDFETTFQVDTHLSNGYIDTNKGYAKHIEFCPDELYCKHHVVIVVDESGSIDFMEAAIIREQLKSFINKQVDDNNTLGTNMHVSLIGLSDSDDPASRADHIIGNQKIDSSNINDYLGWINNYKRNNNGISPSSDYWRGGLERALEVEPDLVILITDGCQTTSATNLKTTIRKFNNHNENSEGPHLFVVGLDNGFYVDSDTPLNRGRLSMNQDPNYNPELTRTSATGRVTSFLRKSLKYLMEYNGSDFPIKDKYNFVYNQANEMVDYFGANDFRFLREEINYLSNGLVTDSLNPNNIELSCGDKIPLEECNNCLNFKPIPGKEYILSAWVKEEQNLQVMSYSLPKINVRFYDYTKENETSSGSPIECITKGDIIDGWQRIFKKFVVPSDAVYISIELVNTSESVPVYFDDIRIHPVDGSMKSFVYDPETFRLMSELDENNYSTFYEYDKEGGLIRVKKETSRGVKTIQETRSGNVIKE